jgi:hypothetical protein
MALDQTTLRPKTLDETTLDQTTFCLFRQNDIRRNNVRRNNVGNTKNAVPFHMYSMPKTRSFALHVCTANNYSLNFCASLYIPPTAFSPEKSDA